MTMEAARTHLSSLISGLAALFDTEGRDGGALAAIRLRASLRAQFRRSSSEHSPGALLSEACALEGALALCQHVRHANPLLEWTLWEGEGLATDISARLFTTELLGPDGHFPAEDVRVGLLVSDRQTDYPLSSHSGEETYIVLAGTAEWIVGDTPYTPKPPGAFIHHPAWTLHGRRTLEEPFVGAWRWSGDLDLTNFFGGIGQFRTRAAPPEYVRPWPHRSAR
ncbi:MAG: dimethylsulfonioproprionate lyase family protein [Pseudomonadota bacterium]